MGTNLDIRLETLAGAAAGGLRDGAAQGAQATGLCYGGDEGSAQAGSLRYVEEKKGAQPGVAVLRQGAGKSFFIETFGC